MKIQYPQQWSFINLKMVLFDKYFLIQILLNIPRYILFKKKKSNSSDLKPKKYSGRKSVLSKTL